MKQVLDHGFVRLVEYMGSDLSIARAARVSYDAAWRAGDDAGSDRKLIRYLWKNAHTSPFEAVVFTFEVKAPIFVFRQWHRHRTWSYNELSARYKELPAEFYVPDKEQVGTQSKSSKQARDFVKEGLEQEWVCKLIGSACTDAFGTYETLLKGEVPRELARSVLPVATYSHMFATVNLLNLFKFLKLRLHEHAQFEIREYAQVMLDLIQPIVPVAHEIFKEGLDG